MHTPSFKEDHISQIPSLQLLQNLGYSYLMPSEALDQRNGRTTNVLLEHILRSQLKTMNAFEYMGREYPYSDASIELAIRALKDVPVQEGYMASCTHVYDLLTQGIALEETISGDKKSYTLQFIDWRNPKNNVYHVTEEYSVVRATSSEHYRPDIVLFVNGIPLCVVECKRPDMKEPLKEAISQHLRNQQEDGIRALYVYAQMLVSAATTSAKYGTNGTPEEFWGGWRERYRTSEDEKRDRAEIYEIKNTALPDHVKAKLFSDRFRYVRNYFDALEQDGIMPTAQDECLYGICRPERLLDLCANFIVFEAGEKKIARYQQYFVIKKTIERLRVMENGKRKGGVIWHTQGSGKSLTMVMLAQAIILDPTVKNPKIILVTDRVELDDQLTGTFEKCKIVTHNASTGKQLIALLDSNSDAVVTTIINKFETAITHAHRTYDSANIFVLVDEGHRSQYGELGIKMLKTLPNACFIAMTGTPLMKKEKNTAAKFGGMIDTYTIDQAEKDGAVVKLLYEGRLARQTVNEEAIDRNFQIIAEPLPDNQKHELKKRSGTRSQFMKADQNIYEIAMDISKHFRDNWQGTGFKGQLVCENKETAIRYKERLDEIGMVTSEVLISPPDDREGEESAYGKSEELVNRFWKKMMDEHGNPKKYEKQLINRFKKTPNPEIIIVVSKLITGFDAPLNTVMYLTRNLHDHDLLQAIARVNRVHPGKEFGYIIDYFGVLGNLDEALGVYSGLSDFESDEISGTVVDVNEEVKKLPQKHSEVWDIFKEIANKRDAAVFENLLRDDKLRAVFYEKVSAFSRCLKIALSTLQFHNSTAEELVKHYKSDAVFFQSLRSSVSQRYSDKLDFEQYEKQIRKLIDRHIQTDAVKPITALVPIFDKELFQKEVENVVGAAAKADVIASRTDKYINEKMEQDPAFYKRFSQMLKEAIRAYEEQRINEAEYLSRVTNLKEGVLSYTDEGIPAELQHHDVARAFYGLCTEMFAQTIQDVETRKSIAVQAALGIDEIIHNNAFDNGTPIIDWPEKSNIIGRIQIEIGDFLLDEIGEKYNFQPTFDELDNIAERCLAVAKIRYK